MKSRFRTLAAGLVLAAAPALTMAQSGTISGGRTVEKIHSYEGYVVVEYSPASTSVACTGGAADNAVVIFGSTSNRRIMVAAAMTAMATGNTVSFSYNGCAPWAGGTPRATRITMSK